MEGQKKVKAKGKKKTTKKKHGKKGKHKKGKKGKREKKEAPAVAEPRREGGKPTLVVVGGGFAGVGVTSALEKKLDVILVSARDYFLCTPSVPILARNPGHADAIRGKLGNFLKHATVLNDTVVTVRETDVVLESGKAVGFDYLVVATGSRYDVAFHPPEDSDMVVARSMDPEELMSAHEALLNSENIVVVGGGPSGVEVAAELSTKEFADKKVHIIHSRPHLLHRSAKNAGPKAEKFFNGLDNFELILNDRVEEARESSIVLQSGKEIPCDVLYCAIGFTPNTECLEEHFGEHLAESGLVNVQDSLLMEGTDNIFIGGDILNTQQEKLAQAAEDQASVIVKNILALVKGTKPEKLSRYKVPSSHIALISLGPPRAMLCKGDSVIIDGWIGAKMKRAAEWKMMLGHK